MTQMTLQRVAWQLPLLLLLLAVLTPGMPWLSPVIGFWPLWLAAIPAMAWALERCRRPVKSSAMVPKPGLQVLVFPVARQLMPESRQVSRHAA